MSDTDTDDGAPITPIRPATLGKRYALTEAGNSERFWDMYRDRLRFVPKWGAWMEYARTHWRLDEGDVRVLGMAKLANRAIAVEAQDCTDGKEFQAHLDYAKASERLGNRIATVKGARSEATTLEPEDFDRDPMLFNVQNGTIELTTGELREHRPADHITRVSPWVFDPDAKCTRFDAFLLEVLPDAPTVEYVWRAVGYLLTGRTDEHALFFAHGKGRNGKTTLIKVLLTMLGPYGAQALNDLLLAKHGEQHPVGIADLHGKRLVALTEIDDHRRWDAATLKFLTGGDRVTARRMRENPWSFDPTHKFLIAANSKPSASATDEALWARVKLIGFNRRFEGAARDPALFEKLTAEIPGILAKAVKACLRWQANGLGEPPAVTEAVASYRREVDPLAGFFEGRARGEGARVTRAELRTAYEEWAKSRGEEPMSPRAFAERVRALEGVSEAKVRDRSGSPRDGWKGIGGEVAGSDGVAPYGGYDGISEPREGVIGENASTNPLPPYNREPGEDDGDEGGSS
jgi:putative DNA primase/helicase